MKLQEYFDRGSLMTANTGWFYGLIFTVAGVLLLNIWVFLFGALLMIAGKIIERNNRKWKDRAAKQARKPCATGSRGVLDGHRPILQRQPQYYQPAIELPLAKTLALGAGKLT